MNPMPTIQERTAQVREKWAREMAWMTAERMRLYQCQGRGRTGLGGLPGMGTFEMNSLVNGAGL